jgi:hypothetical protein
VGIQYFDALGRGHERAARFTRRIPHEKQKAGLYAAGTMPLKVERVDLNALVFERGS